jgi:predicted 3-demethylubiquinone-9 3-methyltransferase (glyoxalase superfamily)
MQKITPCLWFNGNAEEAVAFYTRIFKNSKIGDRVYYADTEEITGQPEGEVCTIEFELEGQQYIALNAGPEFKFSEAVSLMINCKDQAELDYYWENLLADGGKESECGWLKDKFGFSWQVVPSHWQELYTSGDRAQSDRVMKALMKMVKLDIATLEKAAKGS